MVEVATTKEISEFLPSPTRVLPWLSKTLKYLYQLVRASSQESYSKQLIGPIVVLITILLIELFFGPRLRATDPIIIFYVLVIYSAFTGGLRSALLSSLIIGTYAAYYYSAPGHLFVYNTENFQNLVVGTVITPLSAIIAGLLKHHSTLVEDERTQRLRAELSASTWYRSEKQYRMLFTHNPYPMWIYSSKTLKFLAVNQTAIKQYGFSRAEFLKMTLEEIRPVEEIPVLLKYKREHIDRLKQSAVQFTGTWKHQKKDSSIIFVEASSSPITFAGQRAILSLVVDITERKRLDELKKEFLSSVAHELKTPITSLKLLVETHLSHYKKQQRDEVNPKELTFIENELDRLTRLVNEILDVQRIETGRLKLSKEVIDLKPLILQVITQIRLVSPSYQIGLKAPSNLIAEIDPDRVRQVLINIISNAVKHSLSKSKIEIIAKKYPQALQISIKDSGEGIPEAKLPLIFDRFYQVDGEVKEGFGLGLYISKEIVERHGGKIWAESVVGKGSTFHFTLPLKQPMPA